MGIDFEELSDVLKHSVRRKIILALYERKSMPYVELMNFVEVANTGKFNYHLKILGDLIEKDQSGRYCLTEKGQMAALLLQKFPEKRAEPKPLNMADATVIGFIGFVLVAVNPVFLGSIFYCFDPARIDSAVLRYDLRSAFNVYIRPNSSGRGYVAANC